MRYILQYNEDREAACGGERCSVCKHHEYLILDYTPRVIIHSQMDKDVDWVLDSRRYIHFGDSLDRVPCYNSYAIVEEKED